MRLKIKEIRESKKLTQDHLVDITGIPKRSYNNYESGKTDIPHTRLQDIANALGVSVGYIFELSNGEINKVESNYVNEEDSTEKYSLNNKLEEIISEKVLEVMNSERLILNNKMNNIIESIGNLLLSIEDLKDYNKESSSHR